MTTIINSPGEKSEDGSAVGLILGILITLVLVGLFIFYLLPTLQTAEPTNNPSMDIEIDIPTPTPTPTPTPEPTPTPTE